MPAFSLPVRVYWEDTDAGGVVYHARYVAFMERARSEWMRDQGYGQELLRQDHGLVWAVRAMQLDFIKPARLDDLLQIGVGLQQCRGASAVFEQHVHCDGRLLSTAVVRVAALDSTSFRPRAIPSPLLEDLQALQRGTPRPARSL